MEIDLIVKIKSLSKVEITGLTVWASGTDTCQLAGGGAVGIGSFTSKGGDLYTAKTISGGTSTRTVLRLIGHDGEVVTSGDSKIIFGATEKSLSYTEGMGTIGANSNHYLYRHSDSMLLAWDMCSVGR